jgi:CrcB protein
MAEWQKLLYLAAMGATGTVARYGLDVLIQRYCGYRFPWGILVVNVLGCFLFGVISTVSEERLGTSLEMRFVILAGFLGAFTTFSTFAFQTGEFLRTSRWHLALANVAAQLILGLACLFAGMALAKRL